MAIQKVQKAYTIITTPNPVDPTLRCTYRKTTKPNYTQRIRFYNVCTVSPKRNIEMKQISHQLWRLPSVLKNLSVPFSPHNPQQRETRDPPKSLASNIPKTFERNHHHITNTI